MARVPDPELFREVFGRFATGVAVITSAGPAGAGGMTANAICSLSLDPLLALVCFENQARTLPIVREAGRFAVNVLSAGQEHLARLFASKLPESEKLDTVEHRSEAGVPIIEGALAWAVCDLRELIAGGDHTIAIGEVVALGLGDGQPLLWYAGRYHDWPAARASAARVVQIRTSRLARPSPAARASSTTITSAASVITPDLALDDRVHDRVLLVLGQLPDLGGRLEPTRIQNHLRRGHPQLLGDERDAERQQPVDQVQPRRLVPDQHEHAAERDLQHDHRLPSPQHPPEPHAETARHQHQAPHRPATLLSTIANTPTAMWTSFTAADPIRSRSLRPQALRAGQTGKKVPAPRRSQRPRHSRIPH